EDDVVGRVGRWLMLQPLAEAVHAMTRVACRLAEQVALDALGVLDRFLDARAPAPAAHRVEEVHRPGSEQERTGKTGELEHVRPPVRRRRNIRATASFSWLSGTPLRTCTR